MVKKAVIWICQQLLLHWDWMPVHRHVHSQWTQWTAEQKQGSMTRLRQQEKDWLRTLHAEKHLIIPKYVFEQISDKQLVNKEYIEAAKEIVYHLENCAIGSDAKRKQSIAKLKQKFRDAKTLELSLANDIALKDIRG